MELDGSGAARMWLVVMLDGRYEVDEDRLTLELAAEGGKEQEQPIVGTWRRDGEDLVVAFVQEGGANSTRTYRRHGDMAAGVVGAWTTPHYTGGDSYERFAEDGTWAFRLPMLPTVSAEGVWRVKDDLLVLEWSGTALEATQPLALSSDEHSLIDESGATKFARTDAPWHPRIR